MNSLKTIFFILLVLAVIFFAAAGWDFFSQPDWQTTGLGSIKTIFDNALRSNRSLPPSENNFYLD